MVGLEYKLLWYLYVLRFYLFRGIIGNLKIVILENLNFFNRKEIVDYGSYIVIII